MTRRIGMTAAALLLSVACLAQAKDVDALDLIRRMSETYETLASYHFELTITTELLEGEQKGTTYRSPVVVAVSESGRVRAELNDPDAALHTVFDGETTWIHVPQLNQYSRRTLEELPVGVGPTAIATEFGARYAALSDSVETAVVVGTEELETGVCTVLEVTYRADAELQDAPDGPATLWIDKERNVVLRERYRAQLPIGPSRMVDALRTMDVTLASVNEPLDDELFEFTPPEGAQEVEPLDLFDRKLVGREALDFTLPDLDDKDVELASLRGRVVMLDFWATWCGPCRVELPHVQKLHEEFGDDLVVLGINNEPPATARAYLEQNDYTFATLTDATRQVSSAYGIQGIPTVFVIDRNGRIVEHYVGARSEADLRAALMKAGLE